MRINVSYPSAALLSRVLATPKEAAEPAQDRPRFAEAMDAAMAGQIAVSAVVPPRTRAAAYRPAEKKEPRERRQNDGRKEERPSRGGSFWA
jgi:hypothetical protein